MTTFYILSFQIPGMTNNTIFTNEAAALKNTIDWVNEGRRAAQMPQDADAANWRGKVAEMSLVAPAGRVYDFQLWQIEEHELGEFCHPRS